MRIATRNINLKSYSLWTWALAGLLVVLLAVFMMSRQAGAADSYTTLRSPNGAANSTLEVCSTTNSNGNSALKFRYTGDSSPIMRMKTTFMPNSLSEHIQWLETNQSNWTWQGEYEVPSDARSIRVILNYDGWSSREIIWKGLRQIVTCADEPTSQIEPVTPGTSWDWIIGGTPTTANLDTSNNPKKLIDIDLEDNSAQTIANFKQQGIAVICYFSAGTYEDGRNDSDDFPDFVKGNVLEDWPENWLDIRSPIVLDIMKARMDTAVNKGCDGVEPDNVDGYTNNPGFPLTATHQFNYNRALADAAHERGLSVALKNDTDQVASLEPYFDFAINEECNVYREFGECGVYSAFTNNNKAVLNAEYKANVIDCATSNAENIDTVLFNLSLNGKKYIPCR